MIAKSPSPPVLTRTSAENDVAYVEEQGAVYIQDDDDEFSRSPTHVGQPGNLHSHYQRVLMSKRNIANPSPLGFSAFALATFLLSIINKETMGVTYPSIVIAAAFAFGGIVQLCAGMWSTSEMSIGNTFGATSLSSFGGFWIAIAIILTPGGFEIALAAGNARTQV